MYDKYVWFVYANKVVDEDGDSVFLCYNPIIVNSKIDKPIVVDIDDKKSVKEVDYNQDNM